MDPTTLPIAEAVALFLAHVRSTLAPSTAQSYGYSLNLFVDHLTGQDVVPSQSVSSLIMAHFVHFPAGLASRGYAKQSIGNKIAAVKSFLDWLTLQELIAPTHADAVRFETACKDVRRRREKKLPPTPPDGYAEKIRQWAIVRKTASPIHERDVALIEFFITSGCRIAEVAALKVRDIDLAQCRARVMGKGRKERIAFFSRETAELLQAYWLARKFADRSAPAFARHDDAAAKKQLHLSTSGMRKIVEAIAAEAGVPNFHPHLFRHGFGVTMLKETGNLAVVQDLMGHASPASTRIYAKIAASDLQDAHRNVWGNPSVEK